VRNDSWGRGMRGATIVPALIVAMVLSTAAARAQSPVAIWEDDDQPAVSGTSLTWDWTVTNLTTSASFNSVYLYGIYSSAKPAAGSIPGSWTMDSANPGGDTNVWDITLNGVPPFAVIGPGAAASFSIVTYRPDDSTSIRYGAATPCYGRVITDDHGIQPSAPGVAFVGPVGVGENIVVPWFESMAIAGGYVSLTIGNLGAYSTCTVQRCSDLMLTNWATAAVLPVSGASTNFTEAVSNTWERIFYRARVE
jgi:hypothetical protein